VTSREYDGPELDGTVQYLAEAPHWQAGDEDDGDGDRDESPAAETVYATPPEPDGEVTAENVPVPIVTPPDVVGQTTFADWAGEQP
jgi:hypothetical protein